MKKFFTVIKREAKEVGLVTVYFFLCFGAILMLKKLLLAGYQIEIDVLPTVIVSALIAAKIVIVLDKTRAGSRFDASYSLVWVILYKTVIYLFATAIVLTAEKLFHAYRELGELEKALVFVWEHKDRNVMLAKVLGVGLSFFAYHFYAGIDRRLGEGTLRRLLVERPSPSLDPGEISHGR